MRLSQEMSRFNNNNTVVAAVGLPLLVLNLSNGECKQFLVDTGSCFSIMQTYEGEINEQDKPLLTAVNGSRIFVKGTSIATVYINNLPYEHKFVIAKVNHNILGYDFWQEHNLIIRPTEQGVEILPEEMPANFKGIPERRAFFGQVNGVFPEIDQVKKHLNK